MASNDPFDFSESLFVAPIPCVECGNNMHCIRRQPLSLGEYQLFLCSACGANADRVTGPQASDEAIQNLAETAAGIPRTKAP